MRSFSIKRLNFKSPLLLSPLHPCLQTSQTTRTLQRLVATTATTIVVEVTVVVVILTSTTRPTRTHSRLSLVGIRGSVKFAVFLDTVCVVVHNSLVETRITQHHHTRMYGSRVLTSLRRLFTTPTHDSLIVEQLITLLLISPTSLYISRIMVEKK